MEYGTDLAVMAELVAVGEQDGDEPPLDALASGLVDPAEALAERAEVLRPPTGNGRGRLTATMPLSAPWPTGMPRRTIADGASRWMSPRRTGWRRSRTSRRPRDRERDDVNSDIALLADLVIGFADGTVTWQDWSSSRCCTPQRRWSTLMAGRRSEIIGGYSAELNARRLLGRPAEP